MDDDMTINTETLDDGRGLSIDFLYADRLRQWAQNVRTYGPDITQWGSPEFVASKLEEIAGAIEEAVRDVGALRTELYAAKATDAAKRDESVPIGLEFCPRCGSGPRQKADTDECPDCGRKWAGPRLIDYLAEDDHS